MNTCLVQHRADPPYTQNTQAAGEPWNTPCSQRWFHFSFVLEFASGYENINVNLLWCGAVALSYVKSSQIM